MLVTCLKCKKEFEKSNSEIKRYPNHYCSLSCVALYNNEIRSQNVKVTAFCLLCKKIVVRPKSQCGAKVFCSKSCAAKFNNKEIPRSGRRSCAEDLMIEKLSKHFLLKILPNDRSVLDGGLELDIYLPEIQLAIELNGPTHYFPIYGDSTLEKRIFADYNKRIQTEKKGIRLITIDISLCDSQKKLTKHLDQEFEEVVKPLIENLGYNWLRQ